MDELSEIKSRYNLIKPFFNEKARRLFLAAESKAIGWGGIENVSRATGVSSDTISKGCKELEEEPEEGFDLESVDDALNSCVDVFNLYSRFLAYFSPN